MSSRLFARCVYLIVIASLVLPTGGAQGRRNAMSKATGEQSLAAKIRRFAPTVVTADTARLTPGDRRALDRVIAAAAYMDPLFLRQVWRGNPALRVQLERDTTPLGRERL